VKEFGKSKVYFAQQGQFNVPSKEEIEEMDEKIEKAQETFASADGRRKGLEAGFDFVIGK
jgi:hypothetical protein